MIFSPLLVLTHWDGLAAGTRKAVKFTGQEKHMICQQHLPLREAEGGTQFS